ncbi:DJ-1/PfpI family protein [Bacillus sp. NP157]|nr:DJ-1/PfpI family protein [Bacillus sp. NP157]
MQRSWFDRSWPRLSGLVWLTLTACSAGAPRPQSPSGYSAPGIPPLQARPGHQRPLIAVVANNPGVELSDLLVPFGILSRDPGLDVRAIAMDDAEVSTFTDMGAPGPGLRLQATVKAFDGAFPEGADVVVVPAQASGAALMAWLREQAGKGATLVSICNGGLIVAQTGLFDGRSATAHWSTEDERNRTYPAIHWTRNRRFMADGPWISTTGVSAAVPASIALIEAFHGRAEAGRVAHSLGVNDWSPHHDTQAFKPRRLSTAWPLATVAYGNRWWHRPETIRVLAKPGADEVSLALTIDAYASTGRSQVFVDTGGAASVTTSHGLALLSGTTPAKQVAAPVVAPDEKPASALDTALDGIMQRYGRATARGVALVFEYPQPARP